MLEPPMAATSLGDDADRGTTLTITLTVLITIAMAMVLSRLHVRLLIKSLGLDDMFIILSLVGRSVAALLWPQLIWKPL